VLGRQLIVRLRSTRVIAEDGRNDPLPGSRGASQLSLPTNDVSSARAALDRGEISSAELVRAALAGADESDGTFGVFLARFDEQALQAAAAADVARREGSRLPLLGIPIGVKDVISTREGETTAQSLVFDRTSISGDAECVARLRRAGAIVIGKTTTLEFALGLPWPPA
jgi:aspartyl-tRNA(Asn)/glutamyl-tRNA(Gln) amidotransferase subunit A